MTGLPAELLIGVTFARIYEYPPDTSNEEGMKQYFETCNYILHYISKTRNKIFHIIRSSGLSLKIISNSNFE
jgi:hypothetical protein